MMNTSLKEAVFRLLPRVQTPAQYCGGELNSVVKDHRQVRGKLCLAFPDTYTLGMSHHGLQVLYTHHEQRSAVGLRTRLHARGSISRPSCARPGCRSTAWKPSRRCATSTCSASACNTRSATPTS